MEERCFGGAVESHEWKGGGCVCVRNNDRQPKITVTSRMEMFFSNNEQFVSVVIYSTSDVQIFTITIYSRKQKCPGNTWGQLYCHNFPILPFLLMSFMSKSRYIIVENWRAFEIRGPLPTYMVIMTILLITGHKLIFALLINLTFLIQNVNSNILANICNN
jgi:hypothetical protein